MRSKFYRTAAELTGLTAKARKCARFVALLGFRNISEGRRQIRKMKFSVVGESDTAVEAHAIHIIETLLKYMSAEILGFHKILGHYRKDQTCPIVLPNQRMYTVVRSSSSEGGVERVNNRLYIPLADLTAAQAGEIVGSADYAGDGAALGYIRWTDQDQTALEAFYTDELLGKENKNFVHVTSEELVPANTADGVADEYLDEGV